MQGGLATFSSDIDVGTYIMLVATLRNLRYDVKQDVEEEYAGTECPFASEPLSQSFIRLFLTLSRPSIVLTPDLQGILPLSNLYAL